MTFQDIFDNNMNLKNYQDLNVADELNRTANTFYYVISQYLPQMHAQSLDIKRHGELTKLASNNLKFDYNFLSTC